MSTPAILVEKLCKRYFIGARRSGYRTFREALTQALATPFRRAGMLLRGHAGGAAELNTAIWALRDMNLRVEPGEVLGVIGRNGAGKSTFLKILSRITEPTRGFAELHGRVGSLLEVGTGFHPELTGRENIFLNGAILGMRRAEIRRHFDEIVAFAEVDKFIDTPVKHYSSGMYVRLAFAVAAHMEPEILLVDEVLAVGDAAFQQKCLGKMDAVAREGRTVLFVSHNLQTISTLTRRVAVLEEGRLVFDGPTPAGIAQYRGLLQRHVSGDVATRDRNDGLVKARVMTSEADRIHRHGHPLIFEFELAFKKKPKQPVFSFQVVDEQMKPIIDMWTASSEAEPWPIPGRVKLRCVIPKPRLYMGRYSLVTWLSDRASRTQLDHWNGICPFEIVMDGLSRVYEWFPNACAYLEEGEWEVRGGT